MKAPPPDLVEAWGLAAAQPLAETPVACLWHVIHNEAPAVLKVLKPHGAEEARGFAVMEWYGGQGAARVLNRSARAVLTEWLAGPSLGDLARNGDDAGATTILCDVIGELHRMRSAPPPALEPLARRFLPLLDGNPQGHAAEAAHLAETLLASTTCSVALHGDLHHDNVLWSGRGWLAIDPKGVLGDPAYEPANAFRNPEGAEDLALQPTRIVRLANAFSCRPGFPAKRVLGWAAAHCALSICWHREDNTSAAFDETLLPRLLAAHSAF